MNPSVFAKEKLRLRGGRSVASASTFHLNFPRVLLALAIVALVVDAGCRAKPKEVSSLQRKEAAVLVSEAMFATSLRDYARAEAALAKAVVLCPDDGDYWVSLGSTRVRLGQRSAAKTAYKSALGAYEDAAAREPKDAQLALQQVTVLALLGRADDARSLLAKLPNRFPGNRDVRMFVEGKQLDTMLVDSKFKEIAL